jgi:uncharacterized protein GlcG (DUF336 family)
MNRWLTLTFAFALTFTTIIANRPAAPAAAEESAAVSITTQDLSLDQAQLVLDAAVAAAEEQGTLMDIAVVDAGGNLKAFVRMDGAWRGSIDIAQKKAFTARAFDLPTEALGELSQPGAPLYGIEVSNGGLITFPGGLPLKADDGTVIGAIGVSGSTVENDRAVAEAGAAALGGSDDDLVSGVPPSFAVASGGGGSPGGVLNK